MKDIELEKIDFDEQCDDCMFFLQDTDMHGATIPICRIIGDLEENELDYICKNHLSYDEAYNFVQQRNKKL